jgi:hypothetical protein
MPQPKDPRDAKRWVSRRLVLEALFYKARHALRWTEMPQEVLPTTVANLKQMAVKMVDEGYLEKAISLLGDYPGSPLGDPARLPALDIQLALAEPLTVSELAAPTSWIRYGGEAESKWQALAA